MVRILLSWIAYNNDFEEGNSGVKTDGPNASMHQYYWEYGKSKMYEKHILLCAEKVGEEDTRFEVLLNYLTKTYPGHPVESRYLGVGGNDLINLKMIQSRIDHLLLELREYEMDILVSAGTPAMHTAWHFAHLNLGLNTRLIQLRPKEYSPGKKKPELITIEMERSEFTSSSIIKQDLLSHPEKANILETPAQHEILRIAEKIAGSDRVTALLLGESGTGKEIVARYIHHNSPRHSRTFLAVNCAALGDELLESRLFGYVKGAFTGANEDRKGLFEDAKGGTLFLDEIGDISPYMQQVLLRALQEQEITPVGGHQSRKTDVRIIAATNKNLIALCQEEKFRWDLYYRLAVADIRLPSLRERGPEEIKALLDYFLKTKQKILKKPERLVLDKETRDILLRYPWPGNVRELENFVERLYVFQEGTVEAKDLPERFLHVPGGYSLRWKDAEKGLIEKVLKICKGNKNKAMQELGYRSVNTLKNKMKEYGLNTGPD